MKKEKKRNEQLHFLLLLLTEAQTKQPVVDYLKKKTFNPWVCIM